MSGRIPFEHPVIQKIQKNWGQYFWNVPEELPELLQAYLLMGKLREVKDFIQYIEQDGIDMLLAQSPWAINGFLSVAQAVDEAQNFSKCVVLCMERKTTTSALLQYPCVIMKLLHYTVLGKTTQIDVDFLSRLFLHQYDRMFRADPEDAVYLLYQIYSKNISLDSRERFSRACIYSLQNYGLLLDISLKSAARLLTLFEKDSAMEISVDDYGLLSTYVMLCFNQALSIQDRTGISPLVELLDNMDLHTRRNLAEYFVERLPLLRTYSWKLAKKVEKIYNYT